MNKRIAAIAAIALSCVVAGAAHAAVLTFTGGDLTDSANWSPNGLPTGGNTGQINAGTDGTLVSATGWDVVQNGSTVGISGVGVTTTLTDSKWVINGGQLGDVSVLIEGSSDVTVNAGGTLEGGGGRDLTVADDSVVTMNGGSIGAGDDLWVHGSATVQGSGTFTVGGDIQVTDSAHLDLTNSMITAGSFGQRATKPSGGLITLAGSTLTAGQLKVDAPGFELRFDGAAPGSATFTDWDNTNAEDDQILINFLAGTGMSMTMTTPRVLNIAGGYAASDWAEALWTNDQLTYNGQNSGDLGDWTTVTDSGLGDGNAFSFDGNTLSVVVIPEPGTMVLVALWFIPLCFSRRRKQGKKRHLAKIAKGAEAWKGVT